MITARWLSPFNGMILFGRLIFCCVPKVACTNWKLTFRRAAALPDLRNTELVHDHRRNGLEHLGKFNYLQRLYFLNSPAYTRAIFVRNPWTRVLSAYRSKLENPDKFDPLNRHNRFIFQTIDQAKLFCRHERVLETSGPHLTFGEFLNYLEGTPSSFLNEHWRPQTIVGGVDQITYQFIGRFENLEKDAGCLTRKFNLPPLQFDNAQPKTDSSNRKILASYFTTERIAQVGRIYASDVEKFGYTPPSI